MYYYKLKSHIKTLQDLTLDSLLEMTFMLHPEFVFSSNEPVHQLTSGILTYDARKISINDLEPADNSPKTLHYFTSEYTNICINFNSLSDFKCKLPKICGIEPRSLIVPNFEEGFCTPIVSTFNFFTHYLLPQIKHRYAFPRHVKYTNEVVDTQLPRILGKNNFNVNSIQNDTYAPKPYAISPLTASIFQVPLIPPIELCNTLGYTKAQLTDLVYAVAAKRYTFCFVGAGGTGINTAYWLNKILDMTSQTTLFRSVHVFEKDKAEISNLLRFPLDPSILMQTTPNTCKLSLILHYVKTLCSHNVYKCSQYIPEKMESEKLYYPSSLYKEPDDPSRGFVKAKTILYGAPNLESRAQLSPYGNFICATHADSSCSMWLNPSQDLDIQVETYGKIQLSPFFMNQLKMAITLLEILATDIDLKEQDKQLLEYSFTENTNEVYKIPVYRQNELITHEGA
jgi:hypothetical protein